MSIINLVKRIPSTKLLLQNSRHYSYIVLVPEIGEDLPERNPLLRDNGLPEFNNMTIEKCVAAIGKQAYDAEKEVQKVEQSISNSTSGSVNVFTEIIDPIDKEEAELETTWGVAKSLYLGNSTLMPTKSYLIIHERARKATAVKYCSSPIQQHIKAFRSENGEKLSEPQTRLLDKFILEGKLNGEELDEKNKEVLHEILKKLRQEKTKFNDKVQISNKQFNHVITDYSMVREFPSDLLRSIAPDPKCPANGPWKVTLEPHIYDKFIEYCPDSKTRWNVWQANVLKAGGYADRYLSNSIHIEEIRHLRRSQAKLLGFETYADMSMETKMAQSVDHVRDVISNLLESARPAQVNEIAMLQEFSQKSGANDPLQVYDLPYWRRKHLINLYNLDYDAVRKFLPLSKVLTGLFDLIEKLFHVKIVEHPNVETWHEDVQYFDVFDCSTSTDKPIAGLYLDLYSREHNKLGIQNANGWHVGIRSRCNASNKCPLSALIFNFDTPKHGYPALLTFKDVQNLFAKFGQALQHLCTIADHRGVAGVSNIEWDAVQVCGNVLIHLLYHPDVIKSLSGHYSSGEPLPDNLINALQEERKHLSGYYLCQELYYASLDLELYSKKEFWLEIARNLWPHYNVFPLDKKNSHPCSFTPIFSGEWSAAYYSHVWSRMLAADVYSAFHEVQKDPNEIQAVGRRFRDTFLALGGSCHPSEVFRRFRGRDPSPKALLKALGINKPKVVNKNETK